MGDFAVKVLIIEKESVGTGTSSLKIALVRDQPDQKEGKRNEGMVFPGGKSEGREDHLQVLKEEVESETGIPGGNLEILNDGRPIYTEARQSHTFELYVAVTNSEGCNFQHAEEGETKGWGFYQVNGDGEIVSPLPCPLRFSTGKVIREIWPGVSAMLKDYAEAEYLKWYQGSD